VVAHEAVEPEAAQYREIKLGEAATPDAEADGGRFGIAAASGKDLDPQVDCSLKNFHEPE
jgi:hypothetical protein